MITITLDKEHAYALEGTLKEALERQPLPDGDTERGRQLNLIRQVFHSLEMELMING